MSKPTIICLTPVKNEAWILERFLQCAVLWADHVIIADQGSDDGSRDIALRCEKVTLIENRSQKYNEYERQKLLIEAARQIPGQRFLIALDADEMLTANYNSSPEWKMALQSTPGTIVQFNWVNVRDNMTFWSPRHDLSLGFMDDGSQHVGSPIHSPRIPLPAHSPTIKLRDIKVLHYQYSDWERMESKHRWYQCWERINKPSRSSIDIFRQYHHMYAVPQSEMHSIPVRWLRGYEDNGIDMTSRKRPSYFHWDREVIDMFAKYGVAKFKREVVWNVDWNAVREKADANASLPLVTDPRNAVEKLVHRWLLSSQPYTHKRVVRFIDRALRLLGW